MKLIRSYLLVLSMFFATVVLQAQPLYLGEFNIRNDNAKDAAAGNGWAVRFAPTGSMNYFKTDFKTDSRIDHVLVSDDFDMLDYKVLTYSYWSEEKLSAEAPAINKHRLPSDHYPIGIHFKFK